MTLAVFATKSASDLHYAVLCGTCPDALGEHNAAFVVVYESGAHLDGEPAPEPLYTCVSGLGETWDWAETHNRSFVPPSISRMTPRCPHCGAIEFECVTDSHGLCVKGSVSA